MKITNYVPIKNLSPLLKGKGCHRRNKKITSITLNIAEAHPHSKIKVCESSLVGFGVWMTTQLKE
jgi:hypothetical protein